jgi:drug/metabolite transporter (DMT)-like permease
LRKKAVWITLAMVSGALEPVLAKYAYRNGLEPLSLFVIRNVVAGLALAPILVSGMKANRFCFFPLIQVSVLLMVTGLCTLLALSSMAAVTVITVVTTTPAIVALINQKLGRDKLAKTFWFGFTLCFIGVVLSLDLASFAGNLQGLAFVFIAVLTSSFYRVRMEQITDKVSPAWASAACFALIGLFSSVFFCGSKLTRVSVPFPALLNLPWCLAIGVAAAFANLSFVTALNQVGSTRISIISMLQRPLLIAFTALALQERPTVIQIVGIVLVMIGMNYAKVTRISEEAEVPTKLPVAQTGP